MFVHLDEGGSNLRPESESCGNGEDGEATHYTASDFWTEVIDDNFAGEGLDEESKDGKGENPPDIFEDFLFHLFWLASHCVHVVNIDLVTVSEDGHDDAESYGDFGGGDCHNAHDHCLTGHCGGVWVSGSDGGVWIRRKSEEAQVDCVEHEFDAHEDNDRVFANENAKASEREHRKAEAEECGEGDFFVDGGKWNLVKDVEHVLKFPFCEHD